MLTAELTYSSHDGEEGYPGNVQASADYRLTKDNQLVMTFSGPSRSIQECSSKLILSLLTINASFYLS